MAILLPKGIPAAASLRGEGLTVFEKETRRPAGQEGAVRIALLNLMPTKEATETQLSRVLAAGDMLVDVTLLRTASYESKNTAQEHLDRFYLTFEEVRDLCFDGLIVTGAPVEMLEFEQVDYWPELVRIMDRARETRLPAYYICWAAQAALYHFHGVHKYPLPAKCFGIFEHRAVKRTHPLLRGVDHPFPAPHSRHTEVRAADIENAQGVEMLALSDIAGAYLAASADGLNVYVTGHSEYDADTLKKEYDRDVSRGLEIAVPYHYYPDDDPSREPPLIWRAHSVQIYQSWLKNIVCPKAVR